MLRQRGAATRTQVVVASLPTSCVQRNPRGGLAVVEQEVAVRPGGRDSARHRTWKPRRARVAWRGFHRGHDSTLACAVSVRASSAWIAPPRLRDRALILRSPLKGAPATGRSAAPTRRIWSFPLSLLSTAPWWAWCVCVCAANCGHQQRAMAGVAAARCAGGASRQSDANTGVQRGDAG